MCRAAVLVYLQACQEATDRAFLIALSIPLLVGAVAGAYLLRPPPKELKVGAYKARYKLG